MAVQIDTKEFQKKIRTFLAQLAREVKEEGDKTPFELQAMIARQMRFLPQGDKRPALPNKISVRKGDLARSLIKNQPGNISKSGFDDKYVFVSEYGIDDQVIPYWRIHEYGGTITQKRGTKTGKTSTVTFTLGKRPYIAPGVAEYQQTILPRKLERIAEEAIKIWNKAK